MVGFGSARGLELLELEALPGLQGTHPSRLSGCCTPRPSYVVPFWVPYYNPLPQNHKNPKGTTLEPLGTYISTTKGFVGYCFRKGVCFVCYGVLP